MILSTWPVEYEKPYAHAASILAYLHQKYAIGIIANQLAGTTSRLEKYGLLPFSDLVIASAEEGLAKPDPRIFELALSRSGCLPEHAVMIGDRIDNDIVPAKTNSNAYHLDQAGLRAVLEYLNSRRRA